MDWEWFWSSDYGRDRLLRDRLEQQQLDSAAEQRAIRRRMESRLSDLRGSLEIRLDALSRAFEAYVELDDIRGQLAGFPEHAKARRLAGDALRRYEAGEVGAPLKDVDGYWLPSAINALHPAGMDRTVAADAMARDEESARLFLVAMAGANGAGHTVADLVVDTLANDTWDDAQLLVYRAVLAGLYGPTARHRLGERITTVLAAEPVEAWRTWVDQHAAGDRLTWLATARDRVDESLPDDLDVHRENLRSVAAGEVAEGAPAEQPLIARARHLRRIVANPAADPEEAAERPNRLIADVVRETARAGWADSAQRGLAWDWVAPHLHPLVDELADPPAPEPSTVSVQAGGQKVNVTAAGPDPDQLTAARRQLTTIHTPDHALMRRWAIAAGVAAVAGVLLLVVSVEWLGIALLLGALIAVAVAIWSWTDDRRLAAAGDQAQQRLAADVERARERAVEQDVTAVQERTERVAVVERARTALTGPSARQASAGDVVAGQGQTPRLP